MKLKSNLIKVEAKQFTVVITYNTLLTMQADCRKISAKLSKFSNNLLFTKGVMICRNRETKSITLHHNPHNQIAAFKLFCRLTNRECILT
jgi:hypothetical protein